MGKQSTCYSGRCSLCLERVHLSYVTDRVDITMPFSKVLLVDFFLASPYIAKTTLEHLMLMLKCPTETCAPPSAFQVARIVGLYHIPQSTFYL